MQNYNQQESRRDSPFQGPRPFGKDDKDWFFGRDDETDEVLSLILGHKVVLVYAQSGAGKTSLLNAKIIPELEENELHVLPVARVGGYQEMRRAEDLDNAEVKADDEKLSSSVISGFTRNPFMYNALQYLIASDTRNKFGIPSLFSNITTFSNFLEIIQEEYKKRTRRKKPIVIIFDQLEEIFRASINSSHEKQQDFFNQIANALDKENLSLRIVLVIREDYLAHLDHFGVILPEKLRPRFRLEPLNKDEAKQAIEKPLEKAKEYFKEYNIGKRIDELLKRRYKDLSDKEPERLDRQTESQSPSLVDKIVRSLCTIQFELPDGRTTEVIGGFVEPIYLQVVGQRLWENLKSAQGTDIGLDYLGDVGDIDKALADYYDKAVFEGAEKTSIYEGDIRVWFENRLITSSGTRGSVHRGQKLTGGIPNKVVDFLDDKHMIRAEMRFGGKWYELTHDRLIKPLLGSNRKWKNNLQSELKRRANKLNIMKHEKFF